jgi:predicted ATPase
MSMAERAEYQYDVFISYSHADQSWVWDELLPRLEGSGLRVCIDYRDFEIGVPSLINMERAVENSRHTLIVLTPAWIGSEWTEFESLLVSTADPAGRRRKLLPVMLKPCKLPPHIAMLTYADFMEESERDHELARLVRSIAPPSQIAACKAVDTAANNLPVQLTSFIGREREMAEVKGLLSTARLVTLTGPGGSGKTRLALEVAGELLAEYADGVWWVEHDALQDSALVPQAVATVLGVREEPGRSLTETLTDYLQPRQVLLVLDNCEHLVEACATLADTLLRSCPNLSILATSQEVLRLSGGREFPVPPLALPDPDEALPVEVLSQYEAVELFIQRAQAARPNFVLDQTNASAVTDICVRLDGLPLAIELAAARIKLLSPQAILARLEDRFKLLRGGARDLPARQRALRATIDWSHDLLDEDEQTLFRRLAVFIGGRTLEGVEAVCSGIEEDDRLAPLQIDVLDGLASLVDKSLIQQEEGVDGEPRFTMLVTIHQYAAERLEESGEAEALRRRHAEYFLALAEEAEPELTGPEQAAWLERLEEEHDNLRAALRWAEESGEAETGLRLGGALWRFWDVRGHYSEGRERLAALLALSGASGRMAARAKALNGAGNLAWSQSDYAAARSLHEEGLTIRRELGDKRDIALSLNSLGIVARRQGDYAAARSLLEKSLAIERELGNKRGIAMSLNNLGLVAASQDDYAAARSFYEESLTIRRELGDKQGIANSLGNLGEVARDQGDYTAARSLHEESLAICRELGDKLGIAYLLEGFVALAAAQGQPGRALRLAGAAAALREAIGAPLPPTYQAEFERHLETARQALGEEASATALAAGWAMTMEQAIEYALLEVAAQA